MKTRVINILQNSINNAISFAYEVSEKNNKGNPISYKIRRELNEILEAFYQISSTGILQTEDDIIIRRTFVIGEQVVFEKLLHFGNYYYSKQKLIHSDLNEKEEILRRTNVESASMLTRIRLFQLISTGIGGSTDDYFVERMPQLLDGISFVIDKNISEIYLPVAYNLLNLHKTIFYYFASKHTKYYPQINILHLRVVSLITKLFKKNEIQSLLNENLSLINFYEQYLFFESQIMGSEYLYSLELKTGFDQTTLEQKLRILANLSKLNRDLFNAFLDDAFSEVENRQRLTIVESALVIHVLSAYLAFDFEGPIQLKINAEIQKIDLNIELKNHFNDIDKIGKIEITNDDINLLYSYSDSTLRAKVGACLINIPFNQIERETQKPHGVFEISDMELRIKINGNFVFLCMPFKTGKEIKSDSVSVDVFYQILRPFFHFTSCAVVFITAKKCSQNLMNEIKRAQDKFNFAIEIIENAQLAKLLKINNQLN